MARRPLVALRPLARGAKVGAVNPPTAFAVREPMLVSTLQGRVVLAARASLAIAVLMMFTALQSASAQQTARVRLAVDAVPRAVQPSRPTSFRPLPAPVAPDSGEHANPVVKGAQIGALVGIAAGLAYTLALN